MTIPIAHVVHALPGRTRLRVDSRRHDQAYFERAVSALAEMNGTGPVTADPRTGGILLIHRESVDAVGEFARDRQLFDLAPPPPPDPPRGHSLLTHMAGEKLQLADLAVRFKTHGRADIESLAFGALMIGALLQLVRGQVLPPSVALLTYAMRLVPQAGRR